MALAPWPLACLVALLRGLCARVLVFEFVQAGQTEKHVQHCQQQVLAIFRKNNLNEILIGDFVVPPAFRVCTDFQQKFETSSRVVLTDGRWHRLSSMHRSGSLVQPPRPDPTVQSALYVALIRLSYLRSSARLSPSMQVQVRRLAMATNDEEQQQRALHAKATSNAPIHYPHHGASANLRRDPTLCRSVPSRDDATATALLRSPGGHAGGNSFAWYAEYLRKLAEESREREFEELLEGDATPDEAMRADEQASVKSAPRLVLDMREQGATQSSGGT
ncbi:hypothetical protein BCR37DRAFT_389194 [Protomyces lactucae-debilis]|uniref:Uncharacterized protein n=1 Tax=Protomyces lactucae-debilis TaxID=2754530 RepID=A0A1Y2F209_PROLT|nr:uncharacterized protein BCR37DRAFT_389194 [Protomyces lactucae-debilis]ORY77386.1 hypothetical protein BCR37DRAFT_389194 [Protomyces lactucae-debilis]